METIAADSSALEHLEMETLQICRGTEEYATPWCQRAVTTSLKNFWFLLFTILFILQLRNLSKGVSKEPFGSPNALTPRTTVTNSASTAMANLKMDTLPPPGVLAR